MSNNKKDFLVGDLPEVEDIKEDNCYMGISTLMAAGTEIPMTKEQIEEIKKVYKDPIYFCNNYVKITNVEGEISLFDTYEFQNEYIKQLYNNRFNIAMMARQMGKCSDYKTEITVRNKKTGIIKKIKIGDFYNEVK